MSETMEKKVEALEKKVERLELYLQLFRQIVLEPEEYRLWDWIIANELTPDQVTAIKTVLKKHVLIHLDNKPVQLKELKTDLIQALSPMQHLMNEKKATELLRSAVKMTPYHALTTYLE
ncbi:hypothetical protein P4H94_19025 [Paenibacillus macerans]|uniref:hypothetical protein n=1 Tax=Paenibacillus macerans TaxID=44252 RepID=UPI001F0DED3A|nr:hypothetical protein [Paenibacillus macerans]MBS5915021.1 hypothetical protein [Paenibacillus macerans]MEC0138941.1 hypothetical protein [Paenibacillus macerans]UMV45297.1 hypothetical protein LMZ02_17355 [Paenibacillus macerans]